VDCCGCWLLEQKFSYGVLHDDTDMSYKADREQHQHQHIIKKQRNSKVNVNVNIQTVKGQDDRRNV
jgi:hypothetical protein